MHKFDPVVLFNLHKLAELAASGLFLAWRPGMLRVFPASDAPGRHQAHDLFPVVSGTGVSRSLHLGHSGAIWDDLGDLFDLFRLVDPSDLVRIAIMTRSWRFGGPAEVLAGSTCCRLVLVDLVAFWSILGDLVQLWPAWWSCFVSGGPGPSELLPAFLGRLSRLWRFLVLSGPSGRPGPLRVAWRRSGPGWDGMG